MSGSASLRYSGPMRGRLRHGLIAVLLAGALIQPAFAQDWPPPPPDERGGEGFRRERMQEDQRIVPLDTVMSSLMSQYPGKPLDARGPMRRGAQLIYEIVWLTPEGRQILVIVDARSGQVLRVRGLG